MFFLVGALRAVVELIGLCLLGQGVLRLLAGAGAAANPVYRLFTLITAPPRHLVRHLLPRRFPEGIISALTFGLLLFFWICLAWVRKFI